MYLKLLFKTFYTLSILHTLICMLRYTSYLLISCLRIYIYIFIYLPVINKINRNDTVLI